MNGSLNIDQLEEILACEIECGIFEKHVVSALEVARKVAQDKQQNTQQPVAWLVYNGWRKELPFLTEEAARDFVNAEQLHSDLSGSLAAYRVVPIFTAPPVPRDVLMAAIPQRLSYREGTQEFVDGWNAALAALADRYASQVQAEPPSFDDVIAVQRREVMQDPSNAYMVGLHNGMAMMDANYKNSTDFECLTVQKQPEPVVLEPVEGDLLPAIGEEVLIHLASSDKWVPHRVVGYYAWGDRGGNKSLHRVFVRVVDRDGYQNARLLCDVRRTGEGRTQQPAIAQPVAVPESKPNIGTKQVRGNYFLCQCDKCGWLGSSEETNACIDYWHGDGDYSCPVCGTAEPEEVDSAAIVFNAMLSAAKKPEGGE